MSLKDSMIRGLAVYGLSSMSQCGRANSSTLVDLINEAIGSGPAIQSD